MGFLHNKYIKFNGLQWPLAEQLFKDSDVYVSTQLFCILQFIVQYLSQCGKIMSKCLFKKFDQYLVSNMENTYIMCCGLATAVACK